MKYIQPEIFRMDAAHLLRYGDYFKDNSSFFVCRSDLFVAFGDSAESALREYLRSAAIVIYGDHKFSGLFGGMPTYKTITMPKPESVKYDCDWIAWGGGMCPVLNAALIQYKLRNGNIFTSMNPVGLQWKNLNDPKDIIGYRVVR
jgi:hypothetical protein